MMKIAVDDSFGIYGANLAFIFACRKQGCQMVYFQTKNPDLGQFLQGLTMEDVGIFLGHLVFYGHFVYLHMSMWYICSSFDVFCPFWYSEQRKIWQPWPEDSTLFKD
jgi:hypothetical protein